MNAELIIRHATGQDLGEVVALHKASYAAAYVDVEPGITPKLLRDHVYGNQYDGSSFSARIERNHQVRITDGTYYRVVAIGQEVVGFAMTLNMEDHGFLDGLYVHPAHQGKGVGSLLLRDAEQASPNKNVALMAVDGSQAYNFYLGRGYRRGQKTAIAKLVGGPTMRLSELRNF